LRDLSFSGSQWFVPSISLFASGSSIQRIAYAKSKSDYIAKLDGTFKIPVLDSEKGETSNASGGDKGTALQQSIFRGVPSSKPSQSATGQGLKRGRDDEDDDASMDEDEEEMEMDESD
jgi:U2 small nuclear ribonucleoprotein B''